MVPKSPIEQPIKHHSVLFEAMLTTIHLNILIVFYKHKFIVFHILSLITFYLKLTY